MVEDKVPPVPPSADPSQRPNSETPCVVFEELCPEGRELHIRFDNQIYRLRVTKNGKLILNK